MNPPTFAAAAASIPNGLVSGMPANLPVNGPAGEGQRGTMGARTVHWSTYLMGLGMATSLVTLVAGIALSQVALMIQGGFYLTLSSVAAFYIYTFSPNPTLAMYTEDIAADVKATTETVDDLERIDANTTLSIQALSQLELLKSQKDKAHAIEVAGLQKKAEKIIGKLTDQTHDLESTLTKVTSKLELMSKQLADTTLKLTADATLFKAQTEELTHQIAVLTQEKNDLEREMAELKKNVNDFDSKNRKLTQENSTLAQSLKRFEMGHTSADQKAHDSDVLNLTHSLSEVSAHTLSAANAVHELNETEQKRLKELRKRLEKVKPNQ